MRNRLAILLLLAPGLLAPLQAGIIFGRKKTTIDPKKRVPELVTQLKTGRDAHSRSAAAAELRYYDPQAFPDIVPALVSALLADSHQAVRIDAAQSLAKLRPVQQVAGEALEVALEKDPSMRVRLQARSLLLQYHWAGYKSSKKDVPPLSTISGEPAPRGLGRFIPALRTTTKKPASTSEPPLAAPSGETPPPPRTIPPTLVPATPSTPPPAIQPLPSGPVIPPPPASNGGGPILP